MWGVSKVQRSMILGLWIAALPKTYESSAITL